MAFIPQICLNAVEELQEESNSNFLGEESTNGLNIFEEESKESSEENNDNETNGLNLKALGIFRTSVYHELHQSLVNNIFKSNFYQSISLLKITPPPKLQFI